MEIFRAIDRKLKGYILKVVGFVNNCQDMKKLLNKIITIV